MKNSFGYFPEKLTKMIAYVMVFPDEVKHPSGLTFVKIFL